MNQKIIKDRLSEFFRKQKVVRVAYLFGSTASGKIGHLSDIDIAVFLDKSSSKEGRFDLKLRLIYEISSVLKTDKFDLVIMNDAPLFLKESIIKTGKILESKDETERVKMEVAIISEYLDMDFYAKRHADLFLKKVAVV